MSAIYIGNDTALQEHGAALLGRCETAAELAEVEAAVRAAIQGWKRRTAPKGALALAEPPCRLTVAFLRHTAYHSHSLRTADYTCYVSVLTLQANSIHQSQLI